MLNTVYVSTKCCYSVTYIIIVNNKSYAGKSFVVHWILLQYGKLFHGSAFGKNKNNFLHIQYIDTQNDTYKLERNGL